MSIQFAGAAGCCIFVAVPLDPAGVDPIGRTNIVATRFMGCRLPETLAVATAGAAIAEISLQTLQFQRCLYCGRRADSCLTFVHD